MKHVFSVAALACAIALPATAQEFRWDMPNTFGRSSSDGVADVLFAELVREKSGGRIEIVHHFDGSLGFRGSDILDAVADGAVPIARHATPFYGGQDPMFLLSTLPFLTSTSADVQTMRDISLPYMEAAFARFDQVIVSAGLFPPSGIWSRNPIETLDDLQGLRLRAFDLNSLETFAGAGAAAVNLNWGDVFPALSTGLIDAVVTSADLGNASGIESYTPSFLEINWAVPISYVTINRDVWDGLPEDLQAAVLEAGAETTRRTFERLQTQVAENYAEMREKGVSIIETPDEALMEALRAAAEPVLESWRAAAGDRASALDAYLAAVGRD